MLKEGMEVDEEEVDTHQGRKRAAEDDLTGEQRLTKRFHLLDLDNARQLYVPTQQRSPSRRQRANAVSDHMRLEDSKHRVYIYDLDEELSSAESDEEKLIFLPDIEKKLANLPRSVLTGETTPKGNEVVLYNVPESLSVSRDEDNVRRAILESRARVREAQVNNFSPEGQPDSGQVDYTNSHDCTMQDNHTLRKECKEDDMDLEI